MRPAKRPPGQPREGSYEDDKSIGCKENPRFKVICDRESETLLGLKWTNRKGNMEMWRGGKVERDQLRVKGWGGKGLTKQGSRLDRQGEYVYSRNLGYERALNEQNI